jgi:predicted histidine transporter YuiF (NhaC family)
VVLAFLAPAAQASGINDVSFSGMWVIGGSAVIGLIMAVLTVFITRREVESKLSEVTRRQDELEKWRDKQSEGSMALRRDIMGEVTALHEKINRVDKAVTGVEVETRIQSRMMSAVARKLNVLTPDDGRDS